MVPEYLNNVENYILNEIKRYGTLCFPLIDSENSTDVSSIAKRVEELGASAILIGGSSIIDQIELSKIISQIKLSVNIPVILFPGNVTGVSPNADAILFMSLLNSENPYFITGAQALGAIGVKKSKLEALPTGYLIIGGGGIRNSEIAKHLAEAGADIIVVGTMIENDNNWEKKLSDIIQLIRK